MAWVSFLNQWWVALPFVGVILLAFIKTGINTGKDEGRQLSFGWVSLLFCFFAYSPIFIQPFIC